jgi:hypothetical protein
MTCLPLSFSSFTCYATVSYYDTTVISHLINWCATSDFCQHGMHDITYDTPTEASLKQWSGPPRECQNVACRILPAKEELQHLISKSSVGSARETMRTGGSAGSRRPIFFARSVGGL